MVAKEADLVQLPDGRQMPAAEYNERLALLSRPFTSDEIEKLQAEVARKLGYRLIEHRLELYAVPLDDDQVTRLAGALSSATGKDVEVKVIIDPTVLGGIVARVGDTVIDGSVRHRLEQLKERIS